MQRNSKFGQNRSLKSDLILEARVAPSSIQHEENILAILLSGVGNVVYKDIAHILDSSIYFYKDEHVKLFDIIIALSRHQKSHDLTNVIFEVNKLGYAEDSEYFTPYELMKLINTHEILKSKDTCISYCELIKNLWRNREFIKLGSEIVNMGFDGENPEDIAVSIHRAIDDLKIGSDRKQYRHLPEVLKDVYDRIEEQIKLDVKFCGVDTGYKELNNFTGGWQAPDLIILAARPAVGKTAFALNLAINASKNHKVLFCSLEMGDTQLGNRLVSMSSGVHLQLISRPYEIVDKQGISNRIMGDVELQKSNLILDDSSSLSPLELRYKANEIKSKFGLELIIIDYLQLMNSDERGGNREQEISKISRELKKLAKELNVPIIALSQLSRAVESRGGDKGKIPQLSDLRESGAIEQDADAVMFLYRPEYHGVTTDENGDALKKGETHLHFAKHRNGKLGTIKFYAQLEIQKFHEEPFTDEIVQTFDAPLSSPFNQQQTQQPLPQPQYIDFEETKPFNAFRGIEPNEPTPF